MHVKLALNNFEIKPQTSSVAIYMLTLCNGNLGLNKQACLV